MIKAYCVVFIFIVCLNFVSAFCEDDQININIAESGDLEKLYGIGPAYAEQIISLRPFNSVDDLINVNGIAEKRLQSIKEQGLACVSEESEESKEDVKEEVSEEKIEKETLNELNENNFQFKEINTSGKGLVIENENIINLNVPVEDNKVIYKSKNEKMREYSIYGFALFLIFVIMVLLIRN